MPSRWCTLLSVFGVGIIGEMILSITGMTHLSFGMLPPFYAIREKLPRNQDVHASSTDNQKSFEM